MVLCAPLAAPAAERHAEGAVCAALAADAGRLASKYPLSVSSCAVNPAVAAPSRARQAQQLYLYKSPWGAPGQNESAPGTEPTPSAPATLRQPAAQRGGAVRRTTIVPQVRTPSRKTSQLYLERALRLAAVVDATAQSHGIDPLLLHAIAHVESRHNERAVSPAGARGVMQVMPATARRFGVDDTVSLHDAPTNLSVSAAYLKELQGRFGNDLQIVLAAYNAGEGAVERYGRVIPPYAETQRYVRDVLAEYQRLRAAASMRKELL